MLVWAECSEEGREGRKGRAYETGVDEAVVDFGREGRGRLLVTIACRGFMAEGDVVHDGGIVVMSICGGFSRCFVLVVMLESRIG